MSNSRLLAVFNHHYKNLLLNMPVRHIINKMETDMDKLKMQIARIEKLEINNFFILAGWAGNRTDFMLKLQTTVRKISRIA